MAPPSLLRISGASLFLTLLLAACGGSGGTPNNDDAAPIEYSKPAVASPSIELLHADQLPERLTSGQTYSFTVKINNTATEPLQLEVDWGDGSEKNTLAFGPGEHSHTYAKVFETATTQSMEWQARLLGSGDDELGRVSGSIEVEPLPSEPTLILGNTPPTTLVAGLPYTIVLKAEDVDGDLGGIELKWADQASAETQGMNGSVDDATFARNFTQAGTFSWTAVVRDAGGLKSDEIKRSVTVTAVVQPPVQSKPTLTLAATLASSVFTQTAYEVSFNAADKDGDLRTLALRWADESTDRTQTISTAAADGVKFSRTFTQAGTFSWTARAIDAGNRASDNRTGQVVVTTPPPADDFPLPAARTLDSVPLLAAQECPGAQNGFFTMPAPDAQVEKRRRYVFDQFLVAKTDKTGYDPKLTFDKHNGKNLHSEIHQFGLIAMMFNQAKLSTDPTVKADWLRYTNLLARQATPPETEKALPFKDYQLMDTYMRWHCEMEEETKTKINNYMMARPFDGGYYTTSNLSILNAYTRYLAGLAWPNDPILKNISAGDPTGIKLLKARSLNLYRHTSGEWASQPYDGYNTFVHMSLAQLSPDRELATLSHLGFQATTAKTASIWIRGILATYSLRDYPPFKSGPAGGYASHWFFLGGKAPSTNLSRSYLVGAAVNYMLPSEIVNIANEKYAPIETKLMLLAGGSKVHTQTYIEKDFGVFSVRSATRDGAASTFTPGQTTPPGVVWSPKLGRANFWLTLTEDIALTEPNKSWSNTPTNLVHAKRGQQWLQHKGTLLMVTDNIEGQLAADKPTLHQIIGSMPDPNDKSAIDITCAASACKQSTDGKPIYQLFYARDEKVLIGLTSSRPLTMFTKRTTTDWQNDHGFRISLDFAEKLANGLAIEATDYASAAGATMQEKLDNWKQTIIEKTSFRFDLPVDNKRRSRLEYTDHLGVVMQKEYTWSGNAPYWRTKGWTDSSNPDPRPLEIINGTPVDHTVWPSAENRLVFQPTVALVACPLYVKKPNNTGWLKIWDNTTPPFTPSTLCKVPA